MMLKRAYLVMLGLCLGLGSVAIGEVQPLDGMGVFTIYRNANSIECHLYRTVGDKVLKYALEFEGSFGEDYEIRKLPEITGIEQAPKAIFDRLWKSERHSPSFDFALDGQGRVLLVVEQENSGPRILRGTQAKWENAQSLARIFNRSQKGEAEAVKKSAEKKMSSVSTEERDTKREENKNSPLEKRELAAPEDRMSHTNVPELPKAQPLPRQIPQPAYQAQLCRKSTGDFYRDCGDLAVGADCNYTGTEYIGKRPGKCVVMSASHTDVACGCCPKDLPKGFNCRESKEWHNVYCNKQHADY